eukprot:GILJ01012478.1.p1 GENE.GILJ01012478.1~~GILJ01012478.1.p1  ORF type:complete len:443 (-),score=52.80 GILJ01012478.1:150-1478(-)
MSQRQHIVHIQDLEPVARPRNEARKPRRFDPADQWRRVVTISSLDGLDKMDAGMANIIAFDKPSAPMLCCESNQPPVGQSTGDGFFQAMVYAYNNHLDLILSPDDTWIMILLKFSEYINRENRAEQWRDRLVAFQGKQKLSVVGSSGAEAYDSQWGEFFERMLERIGNSIRPEVKPLFTNLFSTTGRVETMVASATVMSSFKTYFSYSRCIPCCGIPNVRFLGTLQDWESLLGKTLQLQELVGVGNLTDPFGDYISHIVPILQQFIRTYKNDVDVTFWNSILDQENGRFGSGSTTYFTGWALDFLGLHGKKVDFDEILTPSFEVPVTYTNHMNGGITKELKVVGGFSGIVFDDVACRPHMSIAVFVEKETQPAWGRKEVKHEDTLQAELEKQRAMIDDRSSDKPEQADIVAAAAVTNEDKSKSESKVNVAEAKSSSSWCLVM